jgi:hypothetical protein
MIAGVVFSLLVSVTFRANADFLLVAGIFEGVEQTEEGWRIDLLVEGQRASGLLSPRCAYEINGKKVSREIFCESMLYRRISVELDGKSGNVVWCRFAELQSK